MSSTSRHYTHAVDRYGFLNLIDSGEIIPLCKVSVDLTTLTSNPPVTIRRLNDLPDIASIKYTISARANSNRVFSDASNKLSKDKYEDLLRNYPTSSTVTYTQYILSASDFGVPSLSFSIYVPEDERSFTYAEFITKSPKSVSTVYQSCPWIMGKCRAII